MRKWQKKMGGLLAAAILTLNIVNPALAAEKNDPIFDLEQVVITATKTEKKLKEAPASVSVITAEDLERANIKTLDDALQYIPGVYVNNQTGMKANKISIRGLSQNRVLVLVDGIPMNQGYTGTPLRDIPLSNIERVEVIKGPFSALYGSSAMGGVINVITKENAKPQTVLKMSTGEQNTHSYSISHNNTVGKLQYYVDYYKRDTDGYIIDPKTPQDGKFGKNNEKYNAKIVYRFSEKDKLTVMSGKTESEYGYEVRVGKGARTAKEDNVQYVHKFDENKEIKVQLGEFTIDPYWTLQGTSYSANPTTTKIAEVNYNWRVNERNLLTLGLNTKQDKYDGYSKLTNTGVYRDRSGAKAKTDSFYLQDEINLDEKSTLYLGGRYDKWKFYDGYNLNGNLKERTESSFSPKVAFVYKQDEQTTWHVSAGKSFAAPNFINTSRLWPMGGGGFLIPSEKIAPEKATSYELGVEKNLDSRTRLSASVFQNEIEDMVVQSSYKDDGTIDNTNLYWRNVAKARIKGLELEIKQKISPYLSSFYNYTYNDSKIIKHEKANLAGNQVPAVPKETICLGFNYEKDKILANIRGRYVSRVYDADDNKVAYQPHFVVDSKISYKIGENTELALCVDNLFNKKYYEDNLAPGRTVTLEITQKF